MTVSEEAEIPTRRGAAKTDKAQHAKRGSGDVKPPAKIEKPRRSTRQVEYADQEPRRARGRREQYVRLRLRLHSGRLTFAHSPLVDAPPAQARGFPGTNAYEVTLGDRLLHAGPLPDLGEQRSFANPEGPPEQHGHYITEHRVREFTARVSADELTPETIGEITVRLHRVKEEARAERVGTMPLGVQFEREMRPVAELVGPPDSVLPEAIRKRGGRTPQV